MKITPQIKRLLRTNLALTFLCIISIGILVLIWKSPKVDFTEMGTVEGNLSVGITDAVSRNDSVFDYDRENDGSSTQALALSPLRNMPAPTKFKSFTYETDDAITVSLDCNDAYYVVIIYPLEVDYRIDLLSAKYNSAVPCIKGKSYQEKIELTGKGFVVGEKYYIIRASQAKKGGWHDPY